VARRRAAGIDSAAFPHLDEKTCARYEEAEAVIDLALSPLKVLCPDCPYREGCPHDQQYREALESPHKVATHKRGYVSLPLLTKGTSVLIIDEGESETVAPVHSLATRYELPEYNLKPDEKPNIDREHPLVVVGRIADQAARVATDPNQGFYRRLGEVARYLDRELHAAFETVEVPMPKASKHIPPSWQSDLHQAVVDLGIDRSQRPPADAMRIAVLATQGALRFIGVARNESLDVGSVRKFNSVLTAIGRVELPHISTLICNATLDLHEIQLLVDRPVRDITPRGTLPLVKPVLQICPRYEVTMSRRLERAADDLRGILHDLPQYARVGVITHKTHYKEIREALGEPYSSRITLVGYYGDGLSRGSNEWIEKCDVLILLGPPRPGNPSIRQHLIRLGKIRAANLTDKQADWHESTWSGTTESGEKVEIQTPRYRNEDWHRAYCAITKTQLKQAIGRGRGILPEGIPVYVVTTEDIGSIGVGTQNEDQTGRVPIADAGFPPLKREHAEVLAVLAGTTPLEPMKTAEVAARLGLPDTDSGRRTARDYLEILREQGRVRLQRSGKGRGRRKERKKGWHVTTPPSARVNSSP
jgi:hypothetical protein